MSARLASALLLAATIAHPSVVHASLPRTRWYHDEDHPVYNLFRRGNTDGVDYAPVRNPRYVTSPIISSSANLKRVEWSAGFPADQASTTNLPQAWVDALNAAVAAGNIPDIPVSAEQGGQNPTYPTGYDPTSAQVCSSTFGCYAPTDVLNAPNGTIALSFDDGPLPPSNNLYDFLAQNNEHATHFFIGENILQNAQQFALAFNNLDDIAVHTWTHPYMTSKNNTELLAEFGWTMWLIHNSTGGRLPRIWRPPYGDADVRVRAVAKEVFGLTTVIWNQDTNDWALSDNPPGTTQQDVASKLQGWITGSKSPGLIILEHELSNMSVQAFIDAYPSMVSNGWNRVSLAQMDDLGSYQNAMNSSSPVTPAQVANVNVKPPPTTTASPTLVPTPSSPPPTTSASPIANQKSGAKATRLLS
ncbi:carbohydrate esterase family 4 protein [Melanogaster broomeanus]|nr:carbohydrate esterase family 4 protein [Melanogaster broomeanus]